MKAIRLYSLILILSFSAGNCRIFKESDLDPNGDFGSMAALYRLFQLTNALNTGFKASLKMNFSKQDGTPYANGFVKYGYTPSSSGSSSTRDVSTDPSFATLQEEKSSNLDANGDALLLAQKLGILTVYLYETSSSPESIGSVSFRVYSTLSASSFTIYSQTGNIKVTLLDVAVRTGFLEKLQEMSILGEANGRVYASLNIFDRENGVSSVYLASSGDGITFDRFTQITDLIDRNSSAGGNYNINIFSRPGFDGNNIVFFIRNENYNSSNTLLSVDSRLIQFGKDSQPATLNFSPLALSTAGNRIQTRSLDYPMIYFANKWLSFEDVASEAYTTRSFLIDLSGSSSVNIYQQNESCGADGIQYYTFSTGGNTFLNCGFSGVSSPSGYAVGMNSSLVNYSSGSISTGGNYIQSRPYPIGDKLFLLQSSGNTKSGYIAADASGFGTGTVTVNSPISGFTYSIADVTSTDILDGVFSSNGNSYFILNGYSISDPKTIFRSTNNLSSASQMGVLSHNLISNGNNRIYYAVGGSLVAMGTTILSDNSRVFTVYKLNDSGNWDSAKLIKFSTN